MPILGHKRCCFCTFVLKLSVVRLTETVLSAVLTCIIVWAHHHKYKMKFYKVLFGKYNKKFHFETQIRFLHLQKFVAESTGQRTEIEHLLNACIVEG